MSKTFKVRYLVEPWNKPPHIDVEDGQRIAQSDNNYGYTDDLFLASIARKPDGSIKSILLMDTVEGMPPNRELLLEVQKMIAHHLEKH